MAVRPVKYRNIYERESGDLRVGTGTINFHEFLLETIDGIYFVIYLVKWLPELPLTQFLHSNALQLLVLFRFLLYSTKGVTVENVLYDASDETLFLKLLRANYKNLIVKIFRKINKS